VVGPNHNIVTTQRSLHLSGNVQRERAGFHPGISSRARTFSTPLSFQIAYSASIPVVIGTWSSRLANSHVTSALRPVSKSNRTMAKLGHVDLSRCHSCSFSPAGQRPMLWQHSKVGTRLPSVF
jgi:hypothetical protein